MADKMVWAWFGFQFSSNLYRPFCAATYSSFRPCLQLSFFLHFGLVFVVVARKVFLTLVYGPNAVPTHCGGRFFHHHHQHEDAAPLMDRNIFFFIWQGFEMKCIAVISTLCDGWWSVLVLSPCPCSAGSLVRVMGNQYIEWGVRWRREIFVVGCLMPSLGLTDSMINCSSLRSGCLPMLCRGIDWVVKIRSVLFVNEWTGS